MYIFFTTNEIYVNTEQKSAKFIEHPSNSSFIFSERTKIIDYTKQQKTKIYNTHSDFIRQLIYKVSNVKEMVKSESFTMGTCNKPIFKNHLIAFPFHDFY